MKTPDIEAIRIAALEEAALIAENEPELPGEPDKVTIDAMVALGPIGNARAAVRSTKECIAERIRYAKAQKEIIETKRLARFYFTVFQYTVQNGKHQGETTTTREYAGDTHPFKLKEDLIAKGAFTSAVILFFKEINADEFKLFKEMQAKPRAAV